VRQHGSKIVADPPDALQSNDLANDRIVRFGLF